MNLDSRAVKAYYLYIDLDDSLRLKRGKHSAEHSVLAPSVHANVDRMPISIGFRQRPPFAAVFRDIQDRMIRYNKLRKFQNRRIENSPQNKGQGQRHLVE